MNGNDAPLLCGIDAGTSRIRVILFEPDGRVAAAAAEPTPTIRLGPGAAEHDPEALWQAVLRLLKEVAGRVERPGRVRSIAIASMGEAGLLLDGRGRPLCRIPAWYDNRTEPDLVALTARLGAGHLHRITGLCPDPTFALLKLARLAREAPEAMAAAAAWLHVADYLAWRLGGRMATDLSLASRTMALDLAGRRWARDLVEAAAVPLHLLAELAPSGSAIGRIAPEIATATGLPADVVLGVGGHDHFCGMLAVGADRPGAMLDSMGTAEALTLVVERPSADPLLAEQGLNQGVIEVDRPLYYLFGGLPTSAAAVEWFRTAIAAGAGYDELIAEAAAVPPGSEGTLFLPQLRLGSPPFPDPVARGAFLGVSDATGRGALFRAVLEGMALDAAQLARLMRERLALRPPERLVLIGGSTRNALLMRIKASLFGQPVEIAEVGEGTCLGAAMLGGLAAGIYGSLDQARAALGPACRPVAPDPDWPAPHRAALQRAYAEAQAAVRPLHALLRAVQKS